MNLHGGFVIRKALLPPREFYKRGLQEREERH